MCSEITVLLCKLCFLCCHSLKAGSFHIFLCLDLLSLGNLHKSQKAFTKLGWIEVATLFCFCKILTMWITQYRHPQKFIQGKETKWNILLCLSLLFMPCCSFSFSLFFSLQDFISPCHCLLSFSSSSSTHTLIDAKSYKMPPLARKYMHQHWHTTFWHTMYSYITAWSWIISSDARGVARFGTADHP